MPTYQYACTVCDHRFDAVQSFSDSSLTECPVCTGALRKVFSSVGIVFKGSGFYRTDSRSGAGSTVSDGNGNGNGNGDGGSDKPSSTPAEKPAGSDTKKLPVTSSSTTPAPAKT